ncbi:MAG TPA: hypothetical protein VK842_03190, partial [bacterium]|nr:hypothetical protein [bacterium]
NLMATSGSCNFVPFAGAPFLTVGKNGLTNSGAASNLNLSQLRILNYAKSDGSQTQDSPLAPAPGPTPMGRRQPGLKPSPGPANAPSLAAYPNPARHRCEAAFRLPAAGTVRLALYGLDGALVQELPLGSLGPGEHRAAVNLDRCAPGLYLLMLFQDTGSGDSPLARFKLAVTP